MKYLKIFWLFLVIFALMKEQEEIAAEIAKEMTKLIK